MGIVMTLAMLLGLVALQQMSNLKPRSMALISIVLALAGLWNTAWYGLQNWQQFWGQAALVSGGVMLLTSWHLLTNRMSVARPSGVKTGLKICLLLSFLLYSVAILRINLGL